MAGTITEPGQQLGRLLGQNRSTGTLPQSLARLGDCPSHWPGPDIAPVTDPTQLLIQPSYWPCQWPGLARPGDCPSHWPAMTLPQLMARPGDCPSHWLGPDIVPVDGLAQRVPQSLAQPGYCPINCPSCWPGSVIVPAIVPVALLQGVLTLISLHRQQLPQQCPQNNGSRLIR